MHWSDKCPLRNEWFISIGQHIKTLISIHNVPVGQQHAIFWHLKNNDFLEQQQIKIFFLSMSLCFLLHTDARNILIFSGIFSNVQSKHTSHLGMQFEQKLWKLNCVKSKWGVQDDNVQTYIIEWVPSIV